MELEVPFWRKEVIKGYSILIYAHGFVAPPTPTPHAEQQGVSIGKHVL